MLDTGAITIVLPVSMVETLGYDVGKLKKSWSWTANGKIPVRRGKLDFVQVGHASARDVDVIFVADERLGKKMLLGMSFLGRFHLSIDDEANELTLIPK